MGTSRRNYLLLLHCSRIIEDGERLGKIEISVFAHAYIRARIYARRVHK